MSFTSRHRIDFPDNDCVNLPTPATNPSIESRTRSHRFSIYGQPVLVHNHLPLLEPALARGLGEFAVTESHVPSTGTTPVEGTVKSYDKDEVMRHLSQSAVCISTPRDPMEVYQDNERFWLIDDRWGLAEMNLLKGQFRAWILPEAALDADRVIENAIVWPLAQLLRGRGLYLLPAAGFVRAEIGLLILSPFGIEPELTALLRTGFRIVGQRWTALRDEDGRVTMLHLPGRVERHRSPRLRSVATDPNGEWIDLESEFCGSAATHGTVTHVLLIEPGRRPTPMLRHIPKSSALPALRRAWPIAELHPHRVNGQFPAKLSRRCEVFAARLSQRPQDLLELLDAARGVPASRDRALQIDAAPTSIAV